jgi:hypothetical protein
MLLRSRVFVPFGQTEVHNVNVMLALANSDEVVVRLDVPVQKPS